MKKTVKLSLFLALTSLLITGCGKNNKRSTTESPVTPTDTLPYTGGGDTTGGDPTSVIPDTGYYSSINSGMSGSTLQSALKAIITKGVKQSYDWDRYEAADEDPNNSSNVLLVYCRNSISKSAHVSGSKGWNREHSFPQSKMDAPGSTSDNHIIFASDNKVNGARSNYRLGDLSSKSPNVKDGYGNNTPCKLYEVGSEKFFDPGNTQARGEVARATMYAAVMYDYTITENIQSFELCLSWHLNYPVQTRDTKRNEVVYKNQKNRNPFVDHPEYACRIWGTKNAQTRQLCGM